MGVGGQLVTPDASLMLSAETMDQANLEIWTLLLGFALSLVAAAVLGWRMWWGNSEEFPWLGTLCRLAAIFVAALLSADAIVSSSQKMSSSRHFIVSFLAVGAAVLTTQIHRLFAAYARSPKAWSRTVSQGLLVAMFLATAYWLGHRIFHDTRNTLDFSLFADTPGTLSEVPGQVLVTDRGRVLPVFCWEVEDQVFEDFAALSAARLRDSHQAIILRAPPDKWANCHGWVFTGGAYLMRGREVAKLLADNGYQVVDHPTVNDVVVYRGGKGTILHTGLVRGVLDDGTVLVESKWGLEGRYLHRPEDQPYSPQFSYYRSPRVGHLATLVSPDTPTALNGPVALKRIQPPAS